MTVTNKLTRTAAASVIALGALAAVSAPVSAEDARTDDNVLVDTRTTGSVQAADRACDPDSAKARIVCRVNRGEASATYPSAPVFPAFGF